MSMFDFHLYNATLTNGAAAAALAAVAGDSAQIKAREAFGACAWSGGTSMGDTAIYWKVIAAVPALQPTAMSVAHISGSLTADGKNMTRIPDVPLPENTTLTIQGAN